MDVIFIGATEHVTGSCTWFKYSEDTQFLVDCGACQGIVEDRNKRDFRFDPKDLSFVLLTHAHIDHCGMIPKLYKHGFVGKVICTEATAELAKIQLHGGLTFNQSIYDESDVKNVDFWCVDSDPGWSWGKPVTVAPGVQATFIRSSHLLGAASIHVSWLDEDGESKCILCTGDVGNNFDSHSYLPSLKPNMLPFDGIDYILTEATYGNTVRDRKYKSSENRKQALASVIRSTKSRGGQVVIPVFSMQRAQDVIFDLWSIINDHFSLDGSAELFEPLKVLVHSPMIRDVNDIFHRQLRKKMKTSKGSKAMYEGNNLQSYTGDSRFEERFSYLFAKYNEDDQSARRRCRIKFDKSGRTVIDVVGSKSVADSNYDVVISSSGMCEGGMILNHLRAIDEDPDSTIVLTGYQAQGTAGRRFQERSTEEVDVSRITRGQTEARVPDVVDLSKYYSGHADKEMLLDYIFSQCNKEKSRPITVFVNHGDRTVKRDLKKSIEMRSRRGLPDDRKVEEVRIAEHSENWLSLDTLEEVAPVKASSDRLDVKQCKFDESRCEREIQSVVTELSEIRILIQDLLERLDSVTK